MLPRIRQSKGDTHSATRPRSRPGARHRGWRVAALAAVALLPAAVVAGDAYLGVRRLVLLKREGVLRLAVMQRHAFLGFERAQPVRRAALAGQRPPGRMAVITLLPGFPSVWVRGVVCGDRVRREARRGAERAAWALALGSALAFFMASFAPRSPDEGDG